MSKPLQISLGLAGVDLVTSPIHLPDGSWVQLQNAQFSNNQGQGGIKKRGGLSPLNVTALAGALHAASAIPLRSALDVVVGSGMLIATRTGWVYSADGTTFTALAATGPILAASMPWATPAAATVSVNGADHTFYTGLNASDSNNPWLYDFDGATATPVLALPGQTAGMATLDDKVYVAIKQTGLDATGSTITGKVIEWDPNLGLSQTIGEEIGTGPGQLNPKDYASLGGGEDSTFGGAPVGLMASAGRLVLQIGAYLTANTNPDFVVSSMLLNIDPASESSWTVPFGAAGVYDDQSGHGGAVSADGSVVYAARVGNAAAVIPGDDVAQLNRDPGGDDDNYSSLLANPGWAWFTPVIAHGSDLLVAYGSSATIGGAVTDTRVYKKTGENPLALTEDLDVIATFFGNVFPGQAYTLGSDLYWPMFGAVGTTNEGYILKRDSLGVWTKAASGLDLSGAAAIGPVPV